MRALLVARPSSVRAAGARVLASMGVRVSEAASLVRALELVRQDQTDVILIDQGLDDEAGTGALARLADASDAYLIYCASTIDPDLLRRALGAGAQDYVIGPLDPHILALKFALARAAGRVPAAGARLRLVKSA